MDGIVREPHTVDVEPPQRAIVAVVASVRVILVVVVVVVVVAFNVNIIS